MDEIDFVAYVASNTAADYTKTELVGLESDKSRFSIDREDAWNCLVGSNSLRIIGVGVEVHALIRTKLDTSY